jgi:ribosomal protein S12 methylthiotransferase
VGDAGNIAFVTLGCTKNEVDSDKMAALLEDAGYRIVDDPEDAHLVIVNTCSFLMSAVDEGLEVIFDLVNSRAELPEKAKILVAGCMPARYGDALSDELTEVEGFLPASEEDRVVEKVGELLGGKAPQEAPAGPAGNATRRSVGPSAYVKISDGCDRFCSYCTIPYIRGRYHSFSYDEICAEVDELVVSGAREIVLIGQDTGIWGQDLEPKSSTAQLVSGLAERFPTTWFRLMYLQPAGITDELLDVIAANDNICSYLDMPLQHCDPDILERMNRGGSADSYLELLERVRTRVPGIMTRTTLMAGFPGETEAQFSELLDFVDEARFDYAVVFPYSQEEGTAAAGFSGQIDEDVKLARAQQLLDACEAVGQSQIAELVGNEVTCLVEGFEQTDVGTEALCRWQGQAPEVDGQVHVPFQVDNAPSIGDIVLVRITDTFYYELEGELI